MRVHSKRLLLPTITPRGVFVEDVTVFWKGARLHRVTLGQGPRSTYPTSPRKQPCTSSVRCQTGRAWNDKKPRVDLTTVDDIKWQDQKGLPSSGSLEILVVRLTILVELNKKTRRFPSSTICAENEPEAKKKEEGEKPKYRVGGPELSGTYTISREDLGHLIAETAMKDWDQFKGKAIVATR